MSNKGSQLDQLLEVLSGKKFVTLIKGNKQVFLIPL